MNIKDYLTVGPKGKLWKSVKYCDNFYEEAKHIVLNLDGGTIDNITEAQHSPLFPQFFRHHVAFRQSIEPQQVADLPGIGTIIFVRCYGDCFECGRMS
jgi:hypothetical protein